MKKSIILIAAAALLSMTACQKDDVTPVNNGGENTSARVKSTADLHNTDWTYSVTTTELVNALMGTNVPCMDSTAEETYTFGLNVRF